MGRSGKLNKAGQPNGKKEDTVFHFKECRTMEHRDIRTALTLTPVATRFHIRLSCMVQRLSRMKSWGTAHTVKWRVSLPFLPSHQTTKLTMHVAIMGFNSTTGEVQPEAFPKSYIARSMPYTFTEGGEQIAAMSLDHPTLFGGNTSSTNSFNGLNILGSILQGNKTLTPGDIGGTTCAGLVCLVKNSVLSLNLGLLGALDNAPQNLQNFLGSKVDAAYQTLSCA
jgi:hypothetical protein